jgi:molybdopterin-synthase adenylyltransferase
VSLSDAELDRYARHIVLRELGGAGQARLKAAHALVIGAGGIGSPAIQYLAAAGIGRLSVVDDDAVALSNLQRQVLFGDRDIGTAKVAAAAEAVARLNPHVAFTPLPRRIGAGDAAVLLAELRPDVVLDGSDNFATRLAVADAAWAARVPLVSAAVAEFAGQLGSWRGWEGDQPCFRCFTGDDPERDGTSCADTGVLGALAGAMGSLAAMEAIRAVAPFGEDAAGRLLLVDALSARFRSIRVPKDPGCRVCGA